MNLESQVVSLKLSEKLKKLGLKQVSQFYWYRQFEDDREPYLLHYIDCYHAEVDRKIFVSELVGATSAFTASELGEIIPNSVVIPDYEPFGSYRLFITKFKFVDEMGTITNNYRLNYECDTTEAGGEYAWLRRQLTSNIYDPNLANAMAMMLVYLLENGLIVND